jgi:hypothetical protein
VNGRRAFGPGARRASLTVAGLLLLTLVVLGVLAREHHDAAKPATPIHPLAIVPPGPALVVSVDVQRLRATSSGQTLLGKSLAELSAGACDQALANELDALALAMPGSTAVGAPNSDALALVGTGRFTGAKVTACAATRIQARGDEPVQTTIGSFASVRDRKKSGEIAARDGLLVMSEGLYLRELIDAADGGRSDGTPDERERDALHRELRRVVGQNAPVIATLVLPEGWLARTLADPAAELSPLAAIRTAALRANVTDHVEIDGLIGTDGDEAGARLERFFVNARSDLATLFPNSADVFARVRVERHGPKLELSARLSPAELVSLWSQREGAPAAAPPQSHAP